MKPIWKLASAAGVGVAASALFAVSASAATTTVHTAAQRNVVFAQTDAVHGNAIVAYDRTAGGGLARAGTYSTGGNGGRLSGSVADHLASQGSLAYDRASRVLYAVNAGSNTISTFRVHGDQLERSQILPSGGDFPVSIAVRGNLVFVLNARSGGSISGYVQVDGAVVPVPAWHRDLNIASAAPGASNEFVTTPGQIGFTPDGTNLVVTTKNGGNSVETFTVGLGGPANTPVVTSLPGTVPFGFNFDAHRHLVLSEAGTNAVATFTVGADGALTQLDSSLTGQAATCWVLTDGRFAYASNAGSASLSVYKVRPDGSLVARGIVTTDPGTVDTAISSDGRYLYVQTGVSGILDAFRITDDGSLVETGAVTVPDAIGGQGIVAL